MKKRFMVLVLGLTVATLTIPLTASAAEYETFVGCNSLAEEPVPSHVCKLGDSPGAFFASDVDVEYEVCVEFPDGEELCAEEQEAEAGVLYVNSITSGEPGGHLVTWYVGTVEVGSWEFHLESPPPPPAPTPVPTPAPAATPPAPPPVLTDTPSGPTEKCRRARRKVGELSTQLRNATGGKSKARIRVKLRKARAAKKRAC